MTILFDLDGTLTDSAEGILNSVRLVYDRFGIPLPPENELHSFVGPPLEVSFAKYGIPEHRIQEAIALFRSRYIPIGKYENRPYAGISQTLEALQRAGHRLYVATSKPETTAVEILQHFHLDQYFYRICGASADSSRISKKQVIEYLLSLDPLLPDTITMVGDTAFDVIGAASFGIPTVGVSWGYGNVCDLKAAGAAAIVDDPAQLLSYFESFGTDCRL